VNIIIEGLDRTGKTTLARALADRWGLRYRHFSKPEEHPLEEYGRVFEGHARDLVIDRFHIGETVWPTIFSRTSQLDTAMLTWLEMLLDSRGVVYVHSQRELTEEILAGEPIDLAQARDVDRLFEHTLKLAHSPVFRWSLGDAEVEDVIAGAAAQRCWRAEEIGRITHRWIGSMKPEVLLVGERVNDPGWTLPFVPYRGTSGHFLLEELSTLTGIPRRTAIVNSLTPETRAGGGYEPVRDLWEELGQPRIVTLGRTADACCSQLPHGSVHHPQYVRRFLRAKGPGWYGLQIAKELDP